MSGNHRPERGWAVSKRGGERSGRTGRLCFAGCLGGAVLAASAQSLPPSADPAAIQRQERERLEQMERERRLLERPAAPQILTPRPPGGGEANEVKNIAVTRFEIDESAVLKQEDIERILAPLRGQTVSLADLMRAVDAINKLYEAAGELTARAFLPTQTIRDGVVRIRLIESRVGKLGVTGNRRLAGDYVRERLRAREGERMSVPTLEQDLARFNRLNESQLRASLVAGAQFGLTDVEISVQEAPFNTTSVFVDNGGRDTTGNTRGGFTTRFSNLAGRSDTLGFNGVKSEGSYTVGANYSIPLTRRDLRLDLGFSGGETEIVDGPFVPLEITGRSQEFSLGLSQPLVAEIDRSWSAYSRFALRKSISKFGGVEQINEDLSVLTLGLSGDRAGDRSGWLLDQQLVFGLPQVGGEDTFVYYRLNASRLDRLGDRVQLISRAGVQLSASDQLPSSELFQIGGTYTVRGYSEGLLSGRHGYYLSVEARLHGGELGALERAGNAPRFQWLAFLDHGGVLPYRPGNLPETQGDDFLTGAGVGVLVEWRRMSLRAVLAAPLDKNPGELNYDRVRAHVGLSLNF